MLETGTSPRLSSLFLTIALINVVDAPWCSITGTAASAAHLPPPGHDMAQVTKSKNFKEGQGIKGRNEPADVSLLQCLCERQLM